MDPEPDDLDSSSASAWPARRFYRRYHRYILLAFLLLAPVYLAISARVLTPGDMSAYILDVSHWLPQGSLWINDMEKFSQVVGRERGNVIRISWPGCVEEDERLQSYAAELRRLQWREVRPNESTVKIFEEVITIDLVVDKINSSDSGLSDEQIYRSLENVMIGPQDTTCIVATLATREPNERKHAIEETYKAAERITGLERSDLRLFGGPVYTKKVDDSGLQLATIFTPLSAFISLVCAWICLRNLTVMIAVFLNAVVCTTAALVSLYVTQALMDPLLMLLPGFWFVMAISTSIHFVNYYFDVAAEWNDADKNDCAAMTVAVAIRPSLLATLTTCAGLGALCTSEILPVWRFGFHGSIGLVCSFLVCFLFLPSWISFTSKWIKFNANGSQSGQGFWAHFARWSAGLKTKTAIAFLILLLIAALGFSQLGFSNKLSDQYAANALVNTDAEWFENEIGPLLPFEVLVRFPKKDLPQPSDCLRYVSELEKRIIESGMACRTLSATSIVPYSAGTGARQAIRRAVMNKKLKEHRNSLADTGFILDEQYHELWRISVFTYNSVDTTMSDYFSTIRAAVDEQKAQEEFDENGLKATTSYAGLGSRMAVITQKLGGGLMQSCFVSAILISIIVVLALRSFALGMIAMLPNVFPIIIVFGAFGYLQPKLDIGSIMTASIAMGIAVDDTIHFMYWFRKGIELKLPRVDAVKLAITKCGRAIASTSLICGFGFFVFFFCDFMPAARFGELLFAMLAAALIGDLIFLPALLQAFPANWLESKPAISNTDHPTAETNS